MIAFFFNPKSCITNSKFYWHSWIGSSCMSTCLLLPLSAWVLSRKPWNYLTDSWFVADDSQCFGRGYCWMLCKWHGLLCCKTCDISKIERVASWLYPWLKTGNESSCLRICGAGLLVCNLVMGLYRSKFLFLSCMYFNLHVARIFYSIVL